jgi:hypothetical protein
VLELIEATLRERGARVLATVDSLEALEIARRSKSIYSSSVQPWTR